MVVQNTPKEFGFFFQLLFIFIQSKLACLFLNPFIDAPLDSYVVALGTRFQVFNQQKSRLDVSEAVHKTKKKMHLHLFMKLHVKRSSIY